MDAHWLANTAFAIDLYKKLNEQSNNSNILFAPICISTSLALARKAAKNETAEQIEQVLHFGKGKDVDFGFHTITSDINKISAANSLSVVKRLYADNCLSPTKEFINSIKKSYPSEFECVDFKEKPEETRQQINKTVSDLTSGKIENMLPEGSVSEQTQLLMLDAASLKGKWMKKFNESETKEVPFRINKTETKLVQMMQLEARCNLGYIKELKTLVLSLPFVNKSLCFIVLLPEDIEDESTGLEQLESNLTSEKFVQWTNPSGMANTKATIHLPKLTLDSKCDLKPLLISMGLVDAFNDQVADFSGMTECKGVALSQAFHQTTLEISEDGVDDPDMTRERVLMHKDKFEASRPFMFAVSHMKTSNLLMLGKCVSP